MDWKEEMMRAVQQVTNPPQVGKEEGQKQVKNPPL